ncbi:MAG: ATP-binding protein [Eubacterium sp.]|nr:ATP-binding protein [Eubacterium sp.]
MKGKHEEKEPKVRDKNSFAIIKVLMIVFVVSGLVGLIISEIVLPRDMDNSEYFCEEFTPQWTRVMSDGTREPVDVPGRLGAAKGELVRIETKIPDKLIEYGYLSVKSSRQDVNVYVDDELRMRYSTEEYRPFGETSPSCYVFVKFRPGDEGKTLAIEYVTNSPYSGLIKEMYYGSQAGIWMDLIKQGGVELFFGIILFLLSVICIIVSLVLRFVYKRKDDKGDLMYLGFGVLLAGLWVIAQSAFRQVIWPSISAISNMTYFALMIMPLPFLIYVDQVQLHRYHKLYQIEAVIAVADTVFCSLLQLTHVMDFIYTIYAMFAVIGMFVVTMVVTVGLDIRNKHVKSYMQIAIGLAGVCVAGVFQIIFYLSQPMYFGGIVLCAGFLFLLVMAVIRLLRNAIITENERMEAIQANKMQEEFLANMSHEIRTPLNAIIGLNEMVLKESTEESVKAYSNDIKGASKTLLGLINDILDFSKIESGRVDLQPVKYWTAFLLTDSYNLIAKRAEENNVELRVEADPAVPEQLFGDETRIRQIITNLLTNAVKYTSEGSITLKLHWRKTSIETAMVRISVADTGIGIRPEDQEKLFQSFRRVDEKRNRNIEGTGLGLVISKQLVELMGGRIWVKSKYGEGSEFFIEFPQKIVSERGMGKFVPHATGLDEEIIQKSTNFTAPEARILVVDDVETNLKVVKNLLKDTEIRIETAPGGQECLDMTKNTGFDLIFLDHRMPEMDGIETLHHMRERQDDPNEETPVIMLTANVVAGAKENYLREGFTDYLTKPIRQSDLKQMLIDYLPLHKVHKASE